MTRKTKRFIMPFAVCSANHDLKEAHAVGPLGLARQRRFGGCRSRSGARRFIESSATSHAEETWLGEVGSGHPLSGGE